MYHSHSYKDESYDLFVSFLKNAMQGQASYKELIKPIILEAHFLANGTRDYFTINRDNYTVITSLVDADTSFFKDIDVEHLTKEDYSKILAYANKQREAILVG